MTVVPRLALPASPTIVITVARHDLPRVMGVDGRVARSLRVLLDSIGDGHGVDYLLDIDGYLLERNAMPPYAQANGAGSPLPQ